MLRKARAVADVDHGRGENEFLLECLPVRFFGNLIAEYVKRGRVA